MAYAQLYRLKKGCKKLQSKKYFFCKQGIQKLKTEKEKKKNSLEAKSLAILRAYLLPLANFFNFNFFS